MPELTDFLQARIAEDETLAQAVAETHSAVQSVETDTPISPDAPQWALDTQAFVNTWNPTRVLAECESKRRLVEGYHVPVGDELERDDTTPTPHWVLKLLAAVYADHPDYNETWRPE